MAARLHAQKHRVQQCEKAHMGEEEARTTYNRKQLGVSQWSYLSRLVEGNSALHGAG